MEYTKGEWKVDNTCEIMAVFSETQVIAICRKSSWDLDIKEALANAQLIASAPKLDNALRLVLWDLDNLRKVSVLTVKIARESIAKADGK